jgi:hypothetical protein
MSWVTTTSHSGLESSSIGQNVTRVVHVQAALAAMGDKSKGQDTPGAFDLDTVNY